MSVTPSQLKNIPRNHPRLDDSLVRPDWVVNKPRPSGKLWLDKNENLDPQLLLHNNQLLASINPVEIASYPDSGPVYQQLGELDRVSPYQLRLTPGSDGAIRVCFDVFVSPGDKVIHTSPTFAMYPVYCKIYGADAIPVSYEATATGPKLNFDHLIDAVEKHRPKMVCLPNPDSPTGTILQMHALETLALACEKSGALLLIDEAYYPISPDTAVGLIAKYPSIVIARTFAKAWGLAGLRIGYAISSESITALLHKVRPMYEVNTVGLAVLSQAIANYDKVLEASARINSTKQYFSEAMHLMGFQLPVTYGNFQHVAFGPKKTKINDGLRDRVLFRESFSEPCLSAYSRFSTGHLEAMQELVSLIAQNAK